MFKEGIPEEVLRLLQSIEINTKSEYPTQKQIGKSTASHLLKLGYSDDVISQGIYQNHKKGLHQRLMNCFYPH